METMVLSPPTASDNFRVNVRWLLDAKGAPTQRDVAKEAKIHEVTFSRILAGVLEPRMDVAGRIAKACGQSLDVLVLTPEEFFQKISQAPIDET